MIDPNMSIFLARDEYREHVRRAERARLVHEAAAADKRRYLYDRSTSDFMTLDASKSLTASQKSACTNLTSVARHGNISTCVLISHDQGGPAMRTEIHQPGVRVETRFTLEEMRDLEGLRGRYQRDHDLFSERELAHLRFLRWCLHAGYLREAEIEKTGGL